jgi:hypothetical protein
MAIAFAKCIKTTNINDSFCLNIRKIIVLMARSGGIFNPALSSWILLFTITLPTRIAILKLTLYR